MTNNDTYKIKGRIWIEIDDETFIGKGKARLLHKIVEMGSLRKAATELNLSYRQAWYSLNQMNIAGKEPLIILKRGGKEGGIAQITDFGKKVLLQYDNLEKDFKYFLENQSKNLDL